MAEPRSKSKLFNDQYEIEGIIGRGQQSVVYKAKDVKTGQEVALKVLIRTKKEEEFQVLKERLRKEALCLISAANKYVLKAIDFQSVGEFCFLVTELAPFLDLKFYLESQGRKLSVTEAKIFLKQILFALEHVHGIGIIHRDIRPENILVFDKELVKLCDFSNSLMRGEPFKEEEIREAAGSLDYLAPEVLEGLQPTLKSDLYSLGITFLELIRGQPVFEGIPLMRVLQARQELALDPLEDIPEDLRYTLRLLLQYDPLLRPRTAREAIYFLENPDQAKLKVSKLFAPEEENHRDATIVLSEEELQQRISGQGVGSGLKQQTEKWLNLLRPLFFSKFKPMFLIFSLASFLIAGLVLYYAFQIIFRPSQDQAIDLAQARPISLSELEDGIYVGELLGVNPLFDPAKVLLVKKGDDLIMASLEASNVTQSKINDPGAVLFTFLSHNIRVFDFKTVDNSVIGSAINLENNMVGSIKVKFVRGLK
jgi:serine/threonine-protein kinase